MQFREVISSLTFRYIAKYVTGLSAAVFLLLALQYTYFTWSYFGDLSESIVEELEVLHLVYSGQSLQGVSQYIEDQRSIPALHRFYYLITDAQGRAVSGDLPSLPEYREFSDGWLGFQMALLDWGESVDSEFLARSEPLGDGYHAFVARNYADAVDSARLVFRVLIRAMLATLLLGLLGGFLSAARTLQQIDRLKLELSRIIARDPGMRLPLSRDRGYVRGLTELVNQVLDQLESLMQGVRTVSDNIAHDLRTPLTRMRNQLSQLRDSDKPVHGAQLQSLVAECDDLLSSFNALLRISALESGARMAAGKPVDLLPLLRDVVELYEPVAADKSIALVLREEVGEAAVSGEVQLLFQMFTNVLDNAIKYTPEGGAVRVEVSACSAPDTAAVRDYRIAVVDSGPGIPVRERGNVFRRFYRVEASRGRESGHGLGLSLVQAIAHYHHGSVTLGSNNPGLRVTISLPAEPPG